jgi:Metallo-peptidase family M12B Reprolysin-like
MRHTTLGILSVAAFGLATQSFAHDQGFQCGMDCDSRVPEPLKQIRPMDRASGSFQSTSRGIGELENGTSIDILVVYTPTAASTNGGQAGIESKIGMALDELNLATSNSMIGTTFNIVHMEEIAFTESGSMGGQLNSLRVPNDGILDSVHPLRDQYKADLVMLVINAGDVCGIANIGVGPGNTSTPENAFSVVASTCLLGPVSAFAHEVGHNMGIIHGYEENPCTNGGSRFAKGYVAPDESFQTVMASGGAPRELYFSNPDVSFNAIPTGTMVDSEFPADSASAFALAAPVVAKYRNRDMNANGIADSDEIAAMALSDCDGNGYPDAYDQDFNKNGIPDACDISMGTSLDTDLDGVPDESELPAIMVDNDALGLNTGDGWTNAMTNLQDAFTLARASGDIDEIWIADGIYLPASNGQRGQGFDLISGTSLYGGFVGTEASIDDRVPGAAQTILSGDLNQDDTPDLMNREDNTINTLFLHDEDEQITLDGLIIEGGNANFEVNCGGFMFTGGGMVAYRGDVIINNCEFRNNTALKTAGLQLTNQTKSKVSNSWIHHNTAVDGVFWGATGFFEFEGWVGGVELNGLTEGLENQFINNRVEFNSDNDGTSGCYIAGGRPIFANNIIANNVSNGQYGGGGLSVTLGDDIEIINCTIVNNSSPNTFDYRSSGITNSRSQITLINTILWGNSAAGVSDERNQYSESGVGVAHSMDNSVVQGWTGTLFTGTSTTGADPMFTDAMNMDYTLQSGSSAIDIGNTAALPIDDVDLDGDMDLLEQLPWDYAGNPRVTDDPDTIDAGTGSPVVDAGAYEYQVAEVCVADINNDGSLNFLDVSAFLSLFGAADPQADLTGEGSFNFLDVSAFLAAFGAGCP